MTYTPYVWLLWITAIMNGGLAYYTQRYNDAPSAKPFRFMMWNAAIWAFLYGVSASTDIFSFKLFIINLIYIPAQLAALAALALALEYTWQGGWLTRQRLILLLIPPVFFVIFAFTSQSHQLWRYDYQLVWSGAVSVIVASKGLVYWAYIAYMLGLALSAFAILVISIRQRIHLARNNLVLSIGVLIPTIVGALYVFGLTPVRGFDWTSSSFVVMGLLYIWVVTRGR
ncbi:MAG: hypothetical protein HXY38_10210, partial [Chloroflexi bacterium]|nr:hypothetical protein [Chloroflexota bacterium]